MILNNSFHPHVWFKNSGDVFKHNIVMRHYYPIRVEDWGKEVDYNLFPDEDALLQAQKAGTDQHSLFGNPQFINSQKGDYRVKATSPALKVGFKNFPTDQFGVRTASLKALVRPVKLPVMVFEGESKEAAYHDFLGAKVKDLNTLGERSATGMATETGVLVLEVPRTSILYGLLQANDVLLSCNDQQIKNWNDLAMVQAGFRNAEKVPAAIFRNQSLKKMDIRLK